MVTNNNKSGFAPKCAVIAVCSWLIVTSAGLVQATESNASAATSQQPVDNVLAGKQEAYGPIQTTDTLWKIAVAHRPDNSVSNYQVMVALFKKNPKAFLRNDINKMIAGQYLEIPSLAEVKQISPYPYGKAPADLNTLAQATVTLESDSGDNAVTATPDVAVQVEAINRNPKVDSADEQSASVAPQSNPQISVSDTKPDSASNELFTANDNQSAVMPVTDATDIPVDGTQPQVASDNIAFKESLDAVDDQLTYLQYEVAKANEIQVKMDQKLAEQQKLLEQTQQREQRLLDEQKKLAASQQGLLSNPWTIWTSNFILAALVVVLFVMVMRRRRLEVQVSAPTTTPNNASQSKTPFNQAKPKTVNEIVDNINMADFREDAEVTASAGQGVSHNQSPAKTTDNYSVAGAFDSIELDRATSSQSLMSDDELLDVLQTKSTDNASATTSTANHASDDLNIDQIIDDMLDKDSKPVQLRSASDTSGNLNQTAKLQAEQVTYPANKDIGDFDDVEFDRLLEQISAESHAQPAKPQQPASQHQTHTQQKVVNDGHVATATPVRTENQAPSAEYLSVEQLLQESEAAEEFDEQRYSTANIDVGLEEFDEFTSNVKHVNVDDDKHGVNAKLDLAQVYIEIGDLDNAAVILKSVMKVGNSAQKQQAQHLLYSVKS